MTLDCDQLARLFFQTVHSVNAKDYTKEQLDVWATGNVDLNRWDMSFKEHYTIIATDNSEIVGFGDIDMKIREVNENKKQFIALLLLADEQENMIDHYLEKGTMYVLEDGNVKAECVVTDEDNGILEIKNIAVDPQNQGQGYGKALIDFLVSKYADEYSILQVGTGDSPLTVPFYEKCGFVRSHNIPNFFTDNYDHPIYECGVQLIDMVYLQRCL